MSKKIKKSHFNLSIDVLMFILMISIAGIGFLMKYVLLPGFERNEIYGNNVELSYLGLDRHQWGTIHLVLSLVFLFLLILHIVYHWSLIVGILKSMLPSSIGRTVLIYGLAVLAVIFLILPFIVNPEIEKTIPKHKNISKNQVLELEVEQPVQSKDEGNTDGMEFVDSELNYPDHIHKESEKHSNIDINGRMSLSEVAKKYNVSERNLALHIGVPIDKCDERLGRLKKKYSFQLSEIKDYIAEESGSNK